jgi:PAS domain S-box-containing protein
LGTPIGPFLHPDDREIAAECWRSIRATGQPAPPRSFRVIRSADQLVEVESSGAPCVYGGKPAIQAVFRDITERNQSSAALSESEAKYRAIFDNAVEAFFQTTPEGAFLNLNPALARIYGYTSADEVISHYRDIGHQLYVDPGRRKEFIRLIETARTVTAFEIQIRRRDGSYAWVSESARAVRDASGNVLWYEGTVEDMCACRRRCAEFMELRLPKLRKH